MQFYIFCKNLRWPPKVLKFEIFYQRVLFHQSMKDTFPKLALNRSISEILAFFIFCKISRWPPKILKLENLHVLTKDSSAPVRVQTSLKIALSLTVLEILAIFHFPQKFKTAAQIVKILKILIIPAVPLYLLRLKRYK